jgi:mRNA interferase RelE/StbE
MRIYQPRSFEKKVKKTSKPEEDSLDREIRKIAEDQSIGTGEKGDLRGVSVHKFKFKNTQNLIVYRMVAGDMELVMIGSQENYFRDMKQYLKSR